MFPKDEMLGFCSSCGVKIIKLGRKPEFLPNYKEHFISLSNDTIMKVGVCDVCRVELVSGKAKLTADKILSNHKEYWSNRKKAREKRLTPRFFQSLKVGSPNTNPHDFMRLLEKRQTEKKSLKEIYGMGK